MLFLFSDTGGGHRAAAQAVRDACERHYGRALAIEMVDIFVEMGRWPFDRFPQWYPTVVGLNGIPWGVGYHLSDGVRLMKTMSLLAWPYAKRALCELLDQHPADVIVSFHPVPNYALMLARRAMGRLTPIAIVVQDLVTAHASWFIPGAEAYFVPTAAARARALHWGVSPKRIRIAGLPTRRCFMETMHLPQATARDILGLPREGPVVLIVGGGEGMGPLDQVVEAIAARRPRARLVAIAGRNRDLYADLRAMETPVPLQVEGFVSNMEIWMRAADLLVTKAGPNTISEAFIAGLPMILYTALPGQEEGNVDHVIENGAGVWAPHPDEAAAATLALLASPERRRAMAARASALAHPDAAGFIAQNLWDLGQHWYGTPFDAPTPKERFLAQLRR
jgi:1,2-diacylglycerol 3-beta-galactosyltransferase